MLFYFQAVKISDPFTKHLKILKSNGKFLLKPEKVPRGTLHSEIYLKQKAKVDLNKVRFVYHDKLTFAIVYLKNFLESIILLW